MLKTNMFSYQVKTLITWQDLFALAFYIKPYEKKIEVCFFSY